MRLALLLFGTAGCSGLLLGEDRVASSICGERDADDDAAVFAALTSTSWYTQGACTSSDGLPPTCTRLSLTDDGELTWTAFSDYPERETSGSWSFRSRDAASGIACLSDGSVIDFALTDGGLRWGHLGLSPESPQSASWFAGDLPAIEVDPLYVALVEHAWSKTNEMDLYREPSTLVLHADGSFDAEFRGGECAATGTFSLIREHEQLGLWSHVAPNTCDLRDGGSPASVISGNDQPKIFEGRLELYSSSYHDVALAGDERYLAFDSYGADAGLTVRATWSGPLRAGHATTWALRLVSDTIGRAQTVSQLRISATPLVPTSNGFSSTGPAQVLVDLPLAETLATAGALTSLDVTFTPPAAPWSSLQLEVMSADQRQTYRNMRNYIVQLP